MGTQKKIQIEEMAMYSKIDCIISSDLEIYKKMEKINKVIEEWRNFWECIQHDECLIHEKIKYGGWDKIKNWIDSEADDFEENLRKDKDKEKNMFKIIKLPGDLPSKNFKTKESFIEHIKKLDGFKGFKASYEYDKNTNIRFNKQHELVATDSKTHKIKKIPKNIGGD